jgi:5-(hydroxymethyl)furfural/furfural oxidase
MQMDAGVTAQSYDVIIAGGGAAGCVLAGRLSEIQDKRVLLVEAGPDAAPQQEHPDIRDPFPVAWSNPKFSWKNLTAEAGPDPGEGKPRASSAYLQGYGLGGGSNVNGMGADRGQPADYDEWASLGASTWGWRDVLPYFVKLEKDDEFSGALHGASGPIPIWRIPPSQWAPFALAIGRAVEKRGCPQIADYNADFRDGVSSFPMNGTPRQRVSASMAYLPKSVRRRANLTILTETNVERLDISGRQVRGVLVRHRNYSRTIRAREVIVSCGALQTPAVLMRSGIGPAEKLRSLGIGVVSDLPAVGANLQNHPAMMVAVHLPRLAVQPSSQRSLMQNILRYSSNYEGCPEHDMLLYPFNRSYWHPLGRRVGALVVYVNKAYSRGSVELTSSNVSVAPRVRFNLLSDNRDFERMVGGLRFMLELLADPEVIRVRNEVFLPNDGIASRLDRRNARNWIGAWTAAQLLDVRQLRRGLLRFAMLEVGALAQNASALRALVRQRARAAYHVCGTCKMGGATDPEAVVDPTGRVRGVEGLRVADASIFPSIPCANTHLTVLMAAEKIADHVKTSWQVV